jgi:hypothetical protein
MAGDESRSATCRGFASAALPMWNVGGGSAKTAPADNAAA